MAGQNSQAPLPAAVIGAGRMGGHHARIYASLPEAQLVGIVDTDLSRAQALAQQYNCGAYGSIEALLAVDGRPASIRGLNRVGLKRRGFDEKQIEPVKEAYRLLYRKETPLATGAAELEKLYPGNAEINTMLSFIRRAAEGKFGRYRESLRGKTPWRGV